MNNSEFKAWFEGFCEGINVAPTPAQWDKIVRRVQQLDVSIAPYMNPPLGAPRDWAPSWPDFGRVWCATSASSSLGDDELADSLARSRDLGYKDFQET